MNCAEKLLEPTTIFFNLYTNNLLQFIHQVTIETISKSPWRKRDLSATWNLDIKSYDSIIKVRNGTKIRNRYNQVPHLTQDTNGKTKFTFRNLKKGIQEFHWSFALALTDKAANNVVVVLRYYINTLKQTFGTAKTYEHNRLDETSVFINDPISRVLLLILFHAQLPSCLYF